MGSLLVVTGPPGAGKSTVARLLADRLPVSVLVEGDAFFGFLQSGMIDPWLPASKAQNEIVGRAAASATAAFVFGGYDTIYDGVLGPWLLPTFTAGLDTGGLGGAVASIDYAILLPPVEVCVDRVAIRVGLGFRDEPATRKMHREFTDALTGSDDRHVFRGVEADADRLADMVDADRASGLLSLDLPAACTGSIGELDQ